MRISPELRVGIFVAVLLVVLAWGTLKLTGQKGSLGSAYRVSLLLESAEGLRAGGYVRMAGVPIGQVERIELEGNQARIHIRVKKDIILTEDCQVTAKTTGILGDRFLDIRGCTAGSPQIAEGGEIKRIGVSTSLDEITSKLSTIADDIKSVTDALSSVLGGRKGEEEFGAIVRDLKGTVHSVRMIVEENRDELSESLGHFRKISASLGESLPGMVDKLDTAAAEIRDFVKNNRGRLERDLDRFDQMVAQLEESSRSLKNIAGKIDRGEGSLGKIVNDPTLADSLTQTIGDVQGALDKISQLKIGVEYRGEALVDSGKLKNTVSLKAQPRPDKYFRFGIVVDPLSLKLDHRREAASLTGEVADISGITKDSVVADVQDVRFNAEIAKRFGFLTLRGGMIESTGGVGFDIQLLRDSLMFSAEGFDFSREANPHLRVRAEYTFLRHLTINAGYDDPLYQPKTLEKTFYFAEFGVEKRPSLFAGGGLRFTDEDLKTLLPFIPGL